MEPRAQGGLIASGVVGAQKAMGALWGADHCEYDTIETLAFGSQVALGITRGRHPKPYAYVDPNEDVAVALAVDDRLLLAVADGFNGVEASRAAVERIIDWVDDNGLPARLRRDAANDLIEVVNNHVFTTMGASGAAHPKSRTTLVVVLLAGRDLSFAALGDSALYVAGAAGVERLDQPSETWAGGSMTRAEIAAVTSTGRGALARGDYVLLATDGFVNYAPDIDACLNAEIADAPLTAIAQRCIEHACDGGAGDNVAVAITRV
ncbi:MAG: Serine/threonine phosphatase [Actinomycetia bacterium]|nr:Serine/threonine phosphatase [Actinomycetes bacterium]